ncbi:MAG: ribbon-helix-helix protein, CopG family [Actinobacteria bacterium]|nr:ribbon-helix-helix protein, CopG family [Actinomycetota bacterium]
MRTTVTLDPDVARAVERLRRERGLGLSAALNEIARAGLLEAPRGARFEQATSEMRARIDVTNVGDVSELLDEAAGS